MYMMSVMDLEGKHWWECLLALTHAEASLWKKRYLFFKDTKVELIRVPIVGLSILSWVEQYSQAAFSGTLLQTKQGFLSPSGAQFLKPSGIWHIIASIRRGLILCLNPLCPSIPEHAFPKSRVQKVSGVGTTIQDSLQRTEEYKSPKA